MSEKLKIFTQSLPSQTLRAACHMWVRCCAVSSRAAVAASADGSRLMMKLMKMKMKMMKIRMKMMKMKMMKIKVKMAMMMMKKVSHDDDYFVMKVIL